MAEPTPSPAPGRPAGPAVAFAEWLPALGGSRLLRVHGEAPTSDAPALVLQTPSGEHRIEPRAQSRFTRAHEWRASYLIAAELVAAGWSATTLEWPGGVRLPLPDPPSEPRAEVIDPSVLASLRARRFPNGPADAASPQPEEAIPAPWLPADPAAPSPAGLAASSSADSASSPPSAASAVVPPRAGVAWTDPPGDAGASAFAAESTWTAKRAELERELRRAAEAIALARDGERAARDAVLTALANVRADLRAARAARAADQGTIAALTAELEAERIAHAVTRRTAEDVRGALAHERRRRAEADAALAAERIARADAETARAEAEEALRATREEGSALIRRIAELSRAAEGDGALARRAREQAESAAAARRRSEQETGELVANLAAAAASLRARPPHDDRAAAAGERAGSAKAGGPPAHDDRAAAAGERAGSAKASEPPVPSATPRAAVAPSTSHVAVAPAGEAAPAPQSLRRVLVALAERDPVTAGMILVGLLPAQGPLLDEALSYDLTITGVGTFAVTVEHGVATVEHVPKPRSRREARFALRADALTLAELLAGEQRRIGRFAGPARVSRRRKARALRALPAAGMSLAEAARAGARIEPEHVYRILPLAIDPSWTAGHAFTIAQQIADPEPRTWYVTVRDGAPLDVTEDERPADATVTMTRAAFDRLLRDESPDPDERPLVRGDRTAVAILKEWTDRARGAG